MEQPKRWRCVPICAHPSRTRRTTNVGKKGESKRGEKVTSIRNFDLLSPICRADTTTLDVGCRVGGEDAT